MPVLHLLGALTFQLGQYLHKLHKRSVYLSLRNAALLVRAFIIKLTMRREEWD